MTTTTLKVKNGIITLPKTLRKAWKQAEVILFPSNDTLIVKKSAETCRKTFWNSASSFFSAYERAGTQ